MSDTIFLCMLEGKLHALCAVAGISNERHQVRPRWWPPVPCIAKKSHHQNHHNPPQRLIWLIFCWMRRDQNVETSMMACYHLLIWSPSPSPSPSHSHPPLKSQDAYFFPLRSLTFFVSRSVIFILLHTSESASPPGFAAILQWAEVLPLVHTHPQSVLIRTGRASKYRWTACSPPAGLQPTHQRKTHH